MPESSTVAQLREAGAIVETAKRELVQAEVLAKRAAKELETAKAAFQNSVTVKHDVLQWRINALRANSTDPMPADLIEARRESASAQEDLEHSEAVVAHLNLEYEAAQENLKSAQKAKASAVNAVLVEAAKALVGEISDLTARRNHLRLVLQGLSLGSGAEAGVLVGTIIHEGLLDTDRQMPMDRSPVTKASRFWTSWSTALADNAEAAPGEYPSWQSLWS